MCLWVHKTTIFPPKEKRWGGHPRQLAGPCACTRVKPQKMLVQNAAVFRKAKLQKLNELMLKCVELAREKVSAHTVPIVC